MSTIVVILSSTLTLCSRFMFVGEGEGAGGGELVEQMETKSRLGKPLQNICVMVYNGYVLFVVGVEISFFFSLS